MRMYNDMEQNSEEWLRVRMGIPTSSEFKRIVKSNGEKSKQFTEYAFELAVEKLLESPRKTFKSDYMEAGSEMEPEAREMYEKAMLCSVDSLGFVVNYGAGYSPDGLVGFDGLIEIKCPGPKEHAKTIIGGKLPVKHKQQCQGGLLLTHRKWIDFLSYNQDFPKDKRLFIHREYRDDDFIAELKDKIKKLHLSISRFYKKIEEG